MTPRDRWIDEGMTVLREEGIDGIRIDRLATRLGLTKGSFHHHFRGMGDYRRALLERYEAEAMASIHDGLDAVSELEPIRALTELPEHVSLDPRLDAALRGWAFGDAGARAVQERVDAARLDALERLWRRILGDSAGARVAALVPHLILVGASAAQPPLGESDLRDVFTLLSVLAPAVPAEGRSVSPGRRSADTR